MYGGYRFATCPASQCADGDTNPNRDTHRHSRYADAYPDPDSHTDLYPDSISDAHLVLNPHAHFHILPHFVSHSISHIHLHTDTFSDAHLHFYPNLDPFEYANSFRNAYNLSYYLDW